MPRYDVDRHVVYRPYQALAPWGPGLAVSIVARFAFKSGEMFFADLCALMLCDAHVFPKNLADSARRARIERMLSAPVQVDDLVLRMDVDEQRSTYQKTKRLVVERGSLEPSHDAIASLEPNVVMTYVDPQVAALPNDAASLLARVQTLEAWFVEYRHYVGERLTAIESTLAAEGIATDTLVPQANIKALSSDVRILRSLLERTELDVRTLRHREQQVEDHLGIQTKGIFGT